MEREQYNSFMVRLWRDPGTAAAQGCLRGEIEHIQSGQRWRFRVPQSLLVVLLALIDPESTAPPKNDEQQV
jgi:hypothetical protein